MAKLLWDKRRNPTKWVADRLGIEEWQLGAAIHKLKRRGNLGGTDRVILYDDGRVTDEQGEDIGNIHDPI